MGTSVSWIATKGMGADDLLEVLGFARAAGGERKAKTSFCEMSNGWTILITGDFSFPNPERMRSISKCGIAIACSADERAMYSVARAYSDGEAAWSVDHDGGRQGPYHLAVAGEPPPEWPVIRDRLTEEQKREDAGDGSVDCLYDAPIELAKALCGYRHDEARPEGQELKFTPLVPKKTGGGAMMKVLGGLFKRT